MIFNEVNLTIAIEDIREVERRRLLGIEDPDAPTREELAAVLEEVQLNQQRESQENHYMQESQTLVLILKRLLRD
ncbi:ycf3-interacting protein 1, chloroplastic-like [Rosa rugosa]|uniref:ycf3-interacting protein 1, chloroplastic-like n=1 Tax=Rosa rugosa TaxID=74645 RepID=UPI002B4111D9|nr:ycf3-interacting protein 1, chloroplastic-like [Rosa rugosa]